MVNYLEIRKYISAARLARYEQVCQHDQQKVLKVYQANLRLSQAFYPLLSLFEVVFRNALNEELTKYFLNDKEWLKNQISGFMSHPSLTYYDQRLKRKKTNDFLKNSVQKILHRSPANISQGKIIADINLGFWTELFETTHYKLLLGTPIKIFSKLPPTVNRKTINQKLDRIRAFRNRIYHNEPIIFETDQAGQSDFSLKMAEEVYDDLEDILKWLGIDFYAWTKKINNVEFEIERSKYIYNHYPRFRYYALRIKLGYKLYKERYLRRTSLRTTKY